MIALKGIKEFKKYNIISYVLNDINRDNQKLLNCGISIPF